MRFGVSFLAGGTLLGVGIGAVAEDKPPAKPDEKQLAEWKAGEGFYAPPPDPIHPSAAKDFQPDAASLPKHVKLAEGMPVTGPKAQQFWDDPAAAGLVDPPKGKHAFALVAEGGKPGTVFVYEYPEKAPANLASYLSLLFWVVDDEPTPRKPEQVLISGRFALVLSFAYGDPGAEWFKDTLRQRWHLPAAPIRRAAAAVRAQMVDALETEEIDKGLAAYAANEPVASADAECRRLAGTMCRAKGDWAAAETHYRAAWEMIRTGNDALSPTLTFNVATWLGYSALNLGKVQDALQAFRTARVWGVANDAGGSAVWGPYNICCALAKAKRYDDAVLFLKEAIGRNAEIKEHAREDEDLAHLRTRDDVKKLLE